VTARLPEFVCLFFCEQSPGILTSPRIPMGAAQGRRI
jgi:hypothetical protein